MSQRSQYHVRVGRKLAEIRERLGVSIQELSEKSKINPKTIQAIENGHRDIKISELYCLSQALNIRIGGFLNSCDSQVYQRRKEEMIDGYIPLKELSKTLDISPTNLKRLCYNKEIPFHLLNNKYYFKGKDINAWLTHHLNGRIKVKENPFEYLKVYGIEPLISTKEAARLLGCSQSEIYDLRTKIPFYIVGRRSKFRISDIEYTLSKERVDLWEISTRTGSWRSPFIKPSPTKQQKIAEDESCERRYIQSNRPGYIVKTKEFEQPDFLLLKNEVQEFLGKDINKYNLLGCRYTYHEGSQAFTCEVKWWGLPDGRENFRVHSAGLSSDSPDGLRGKVEKLKKLKIGPGNFICTDYFTWMPFLNDRSHHARVTYYIPK